MFASSLAAGPRRCDAANVKRLLVILAGTLLPVVESRASLDPAAWHVSPLPNVEAAGTNEYHLWPDGSLHPRVLVGGGSSNFRLATGNPPQWTGDTVRPLDLPGNGLFVPDGLNPLFGGYLIGAYGGATKVLQVAKFSGTFALAEPVDPNPGAVVNAFSAAFDPQGNLHVAYAWDADNTKGNGNDYLGYARRNATTNSWQYYARLVPIRPHATAIEADSFDSARIYYASGNAAAASLSTALVTKYQPTNSPVIGPPSGLDTSLTPDSSIKLLKSSGSHLFYTKFAGGNVAVIMRNGPNLATITTLRSESPVSGQLPVPRGIQAAFGFDGRVRVAWYDARFGKIHYLRPSGSANGLPMVPGTPVITAPNLSGADLRGLFFNFMGKPYLLFRVSATEGRVAFPSDGYDIDGNGRDDLLDHAFGSPGGGMTAPPVGPAVAGVANSANRLKLAFPGISTAAADAAGGLTSGASNLRYRVQVSDNLSSWTTLSGGVTYTKLAAVPGSSTHHRWVVTINEAAPGSRPKRFARLMVDRPETGF